MKTIPIALAPVYASAGSTIARCLKVTRTDGVALGLTNSDKAFTIDGVVYHPGFEPSDIIDTNDLAVGNLEASILPDDSTLTQADLIAGLWNSAKFSIFEVDYTNPSAINLLKRGTTGEAQIFKGLWKIEFRGLKQTLQQNLGAVTSKTCRYALGQVNSDGTGCLIDLTAWTHTYAVTSVTSQQVFTCSAATEASEFYKEGKATGATGLNAGYAQKVKDFAAGVFTLALPMPYPISPSDTFVFEAGCQKRLLQDCKTKYNNVLNFGGEPDVPGVDLLLANPGP